MDYIFLCDFYRNFHNLNYLKRCAIMSKKNKSWRFTVVSTFESFDIRKERNAGCLTQSPTHICITVIFISRDTKSDEKTRNIKWEMRTCSVCCVKSKMTRPFPLSQLPYFLVTGSDEEHVGQTNTLWLVTPQCVFMFSCSATTIRKWEPEVVDSERVPPWTDLTNWSRKLRNAIPDKVFHSPGTTNSRLTSRRITYLYYSASGHSSLRAYDTCIRGDLRLSFVVEATRQRFQWEQQTTVVLDPGVSPSFQMERSHSCLPPRVWNQDDSPRLALPHISHLWHRRSLSSPFTHIFYVASMSKFSFRDVFDCVLNTSCNGLL